MKPTDNINAATPEEVARWIKLESDLKAIISQVEKLLIAADGKSDQVIHRMSLLKAVVKGIGQLTDHSQFKVEIEKAEHAISHDIGDCLSRLIDLESEVQALLEQHNKALKRPQPPEQC